MRVASTHVPAPLTRTLSGARARERAVREAVAATAAFEPQMQALTDAELPEHRRALAARAAAEGEEAVMHETFALVREAAHRAIGLRAYDVQVMAAAAIAAGGVAEAKTGEGKTLIATMPLVLATLTAPSVHVATANPYLAARDAATLQPVYAALGLRADYLDPAERGPTRRRKHAYAADILYATTSELGFDYLRDNLAISAAGQVQRGHHYLLVDEVDAVLIDEARTPLIISGPVAARTTLWRTLADLVPTLVEGEDYLVDEKLRQVSIDEGAVTAAERALGVTNLLAPEHAGAYNALVQSLRAHAFHTRDVEYVVTDGVVQIVDEHTGRVLPGRQWSDGLHQAVEAKEGLALTPTSETLATVSIQSYVRMYDRLGGMSGTAHTDAEELEEIYGLRVVVIPPHKPSRRVDHPDVIYRTHDARQRAVVAQIAARHAAGQPVLVGTPDVALSEDLAGRLEEAGIPHNVLNAKDPAREADIIAQAGQRGAVTIATNMAGRGVDILLGDGIADLGGLCVLATARHDSRRVDLQLFGRSGRQGDPGETQAFLSADDELVRVFGGERVRGLLRRFPGDPDEPARIPGLSRAIEQAQRTVERQAFEARREMLTYDEVLQRQRVAWFARRQRCIDGTAGDAATEALLARWAAGCVALAESDPDAAQARVRMVLPDLVPADRHAWEEFAGAVRRRWWRIRHEAPADFDVLAGVVTLETMDVLWRVHLDTCVDLRNGVHWRQLEQTKPAIAYTLEVSHLFAELERHLADAVSRVLVQACLEPTVPPKETPQPVDPASAAA